VSSINRSPLGLLGFLGIKNFGRNPVQLSDTLLPQWDLSELYWSSGAVHATNTQTGLVTVGSYIAHQPPPGEVWWVSDVSAYCETGAGATSVVNLVRLGQVTAENVAISDWLLIGPAQKRNIYSPRTPFILGQGEKLGFYLSDISGGGIAIATSIRYAPMAV